MGPIKSHKLVDGFAALLILLGTLGFIGGFLRAGYAPFIGAEDTEVSAEHLRQLHGLLAAVLGLLVVITATLLRLGARLITYHDSLDLVELLRRTRSEGADGPEPSSATPPRTRFRITGLDVQHQRTQVELEAPDMDAAREAGVRRGLRVTQVEPLGEAEAWR